MGMPLFAERRSAADMQVMTHDMLRGQDAGQAGMVASSPRTSSMRLAIVPGPKSKRRPAASKSSGSGPPAPTESARL